MKIIQADLADPSHQTALLSLLDHYAQDPMANGKPLEKAILDRVISGLQEHPTTIVFLAYQEAQPVGLAICFLGFATFAAKPLINVHDLAVLSEVRGQGIGRALLRAVEAHSKELGCCKVTLEVFERNDRAKGLYESEGFQQLQYGEAGGALFMAKSV